MSTITNTSIGTRRQGFETLNDEVRIERLPRQGEVPTWLSGTLMRVTPALLDLAGRPAGHWFDGLAMLNAFTFCDGQVSYASKYLNTREYRRAREGRLDNAAYAGTDPCRRLASRLMVVFDPMLVGAHNVNVAKLGERYLALTETPCPIEFDRASLETKDYVNVSKSPLEFLGPLAHMHFDPASGEHIASITHIGVRNTEYRVFALAPDSIKRRDIGAVRGRRAPHYMHSFAMTEHYVILIEIPAVISLGDLIRTGKFSDGFKWRPEEGTRYLVMDRRTGERVSESHGDPYFFWHQINAYEDRDEIVVDLVALKDIEFFDKFDVGDLRTPGHTAEFCGEPRRIRLPLSGGQASARPLADARVEFPQINYPRCNTRDYTYAYAIAYGRPDSDWFDQLVKFDVRTGEIHRWSEEYCYPGEPIIVPTPNGAAEDDAVLLNVVLDSRTERSFLLILDAGNFEEIARAELPHHIPFNFHQQYFESNHGMAEEAVTGDTDSQGRRILHGVGDSPGEITATARVIKRL